MTVTVTPTLGRRDEWTLMATAVGEMMVIGDEAAVHFVHLPGSFVESAFDPDRAGRPGPVALAVEQIEAYFAGVLSVFDLPLDPAGTDFQRRVWLALADIPYGATESYGELALRVGNPKACRAVGMANGRNPLPLVLPCHRVIGADGSLTGYVGGLDLKKRLLDHERPRRRPGPPPGGAPPRTGSSKGTATPDSTGGRRWGMAWAWTYLGLSLLGAGFVLNAFRPPRNEYLLVPSFFAGWYTGEMPVWHIVWQLTATGLFALTGAFRFWPGWVGLAVAAVSWVGLASLAMIGRAAGRVFDAIERGLRPCDRATTSPCRPPDATPCGASPASSTRCPVRPDRSGPCATSTTPATAFVVTGST